VRNPFQQVDEFFSVFVEDEAGRFFFCNLPFWGSVLFIGWHVVGGVGLYLLWAALVFGLVPCVIANIYLGIFEHDRFEYYEGKLTLFRLSLGAYVVSVLTFIGIPGVYFGWVLQVIKTQMFAEIYWNVIVYWWKFFNFNHDYTKKTGKGLIAAYAFHFESWQWAFLVSALVITPALFYWLYINLKERIVLEELEEMKHEQEAKKRAEHAALRVQEIDEQRVRYEKRRQDEAAAEIEKQRKVQLKINEVKGKDPWDSGFL
jgi:hypothetical protein